MKWQRLETFKIVSLENFKNYTYFILVQLLVNFIIDFHRDKKYMDTTSTRVPYFEDVQSLHHGCEFFLILY
jgi:hypothetical protein